MFVRCTACILREDQEFFFAVLGLGVTDRELSQRNLNGRIPLTAKETVRKEVIQAYGVIRRLGRGL